MSDKAPRRPSHTGRPHAVPPALLSSGEPFDGYRILDEVRSPLGVVLWQTVRDVVSWAATPGEMRSALFPPSAFEVRLSQLARVNPAEDLGRLVASLTHLLDRRLQDPREVAKACRRVSLWAEAQALPATAIWYAQAAYLCFPENAEYAYTVGLLCRRNAEYVRADTWFRRAIGLARRRRDSRIYALSFIDLGNLYIKRLDYERAKAAFERAFRAARRAGLQDVRAEALHDLFMVAVETYQTIEAVIYAQRAYRAYPRSHPQRIALAHDVAAFWLLQGQYRRALPVLHAAARLMTRPSLRLFAMSNLARAAGGAGRVDIFAEAWDETWQIIDGQPTLECVTSSLLRLAYGSASIGDWERVEVTAKLAYDLAIERGEKDVQQEATELLKAVEVQHFTERLISQPEDPGVAEAADALADDLVRSLAACAGAGDDPRMQC